MVTFIILFFAILTMANAVFKTLIVNSEAIYSILAVAMFLSLALSLIKEARKWAWTGFLLAVILYASIGILLPYFTFISYTLAFIFAAVLTYLFKKEIWKFVSKDEKRAGGPKLSHLIHLILKII